MRRIKAIVYGVGQIGRLATKYMVEKGVDIVGAIDVNPDIVGKDLGEVAALGHTLNVKISADADAVLSQQEADIAVVSVVSQMDKMYPIFKKCIENKLNVLTPSVEALYPWGVAPELAAKLDKLAKNNGVTITAGGAQDSFRVNMITLLTGSSHGIESVTVRHPMDLSLAPPATAIDSCHIGNTKDEFYQKIRDKGLPLSSLRISLEALIADLGLTITKVEDSAEPILAEMDVAARAVPGGIVKKGQVKGMVKIVNIETRQGIKFRGEQVGKVYTENERAQGFPHECIIEGVPYMHLKLQIKEIEDKSPAVAQLVNRIPDVINSEPGYITVEKMAKLKFRAFPLEWYLKST